MTKITYDEKTDSIVIESDSPRDVLSIPVGAFLDAVDDCLELRIKKVRLNSANSLDRLAKKAWLFEEALSKAVNRTEMYRINSMAKVVDRVRYIVKLAEMEEKRWKTEMLERKLQRGET